MPNIVLMGATYPSVPAVDLPTDGGDTARFWFAVDGNQLDYGLTDGTLPLVGVAKAGQAVI